MDDYPLVMTYKKLLNMAIEIVSFPIKHGGSFHSYVKLPEGTIVIFVWGFFGWKSLEIAWLIDWNGELY